MHFTSRRANATHKSPNSEPINQRNYAQIVFTKNSCHHAININELANENCANRIRFACSYCCNAHKKTVDDIVCQWMPTNRINVKFMQLLQQKIKSIPCTLNRTSQKSATTLHLRNHKYWISICWCDGEIAIFVSTLNAVVLEFLQRIST